MNNKKLLSGHEVEPMSEEWRANMRKYQIAFSDNIIRILPEGWLYPGTAPTFLDKIQSFEFRPDDVVVMTFPKSGTTWMQEILWTMVHNPNLDHPMGQASLWHRSIDISFDMNCDGMSLVEIQMESLYEAFKMLCPGKKEADGVSIQMLEAIPGRRVIKCHYPLELMPADLLEKTKVVYVARNPKDTGVSFYHMWSAIRDIGYRGSMEFFIRKFMKDECIFSPYWPHVKQAWKKKDHPNLHFVFYEDLKADAMVEVRKINDFMDTKLTEEQLKNVVQHTTFSSMKSRGEPTSDTEIFNEEGCATFFRKGKIGDWKNHFSGDLNKDMDKWIKDNLGDSGITFKMSE